MFLFHLLSCHQKSWKLGGVAVNHKLEVSLTGGKWTKEVGGSELPIISSFRETFRSGIESFVMIFRKLKEVLLGHCPPLIKFERFWCSSSEVVPAGIKKVQVVDDIEICVPCCIFYIDFPPIFISKIDKSWEQLFSCNRDEIIYRTWKRKSSSIQILEWKFQITNL